MDCSLVTIKNEYTEQGAYKTKCSQYCSKVEDLYELPYPFIVFNCIKIPEMYSCVKCQFKTNLKVNFYRHSKKLRSHFAEPKYKCKNCNFSTFSSLILLKHLFDCLNKSKYLKCVAKCQDCSYKTTCERYLKRHVLARHTPPENIQWFECGQCPFKSKWKGNLKGHVLGIHSIPKAKTVLKCKHCTFETKWKSCLKKHILAKHTAIENIKWFECVLCDHKTKLRYSLKRHMQEKHLRIVKNIQSELKTSKINNPVNAVWYECDQCTYRTEWKGSLKIHKLMKHAAISDNK